MPLMATTARQPARIVSLTESPLSGTGETTATLRTATQIASPLNRRAILIASQQRPATGIARPATARVLLKLTLIKSRRCAHISVNIGRQQNASIRVMSECRSALGFPRVSH